MIRVKTKMYQNRKKKVAHSNQNDQKVQKLTENYKKCDKKRK
jgi:hypothetical protein